jgi:CheY-like chemotaxis protein
MWIAPLEDNPANSEYIQTLLEMDGHQVFPHPQGHAFLAALLTIEEFSRYDVFVIDLLLPNTLSGQGVMHHQQEQYRAKLLPFIVVSALSRQELDRVQADFPETPIIRKPLKRQQLVEAIQRVIARPATPATTSCDAQEDSQMPGSWTQ